MNIHQPASSTRNQRAFTLVETLMGMGIGSVVLAATGMLTLYGARSQVAVVNYAELEGSSRYALDVINREIRSATAVVAFQTNLPVKSLTLTNSDQAAAITLRWDSLARTLTLEKTGQPVQTNLTQCDLWDFSLYQRTPWVTATNVNYYPATNTAGAIDLRLCKLISMSWKCSRVLLGAQLNTESVQTSEIVLRNKQ